MPQNITIPYDYNKNFHMVIKPILIVNGTVAPNVPVIPVNPINPGNGNMTNLFFQDDDCDDLSILGVKTQETSKNIDFPRFKSGESSVMAEKQNKMINVNFNKIQRKFYRKVAISEEVYSQDTFKQGLNLIIIQRDKKYTKRKLIFYNFFLFILVYEKTFDTNNNRNESEEMADIIKDTPCSKIIVITGIGKWMGAMTPSLMKEIKQIGGPDLNALYSPDEDDNSMADHAFILIGRRGLCRYNGIFRVKNFDLSRTMSKLFPDSSSDPNDCFFDDITLENQKNKNSEKQFFHLIDLRLTLNINNDNRFAWDAPTISTTSPFQGSIHGGQEIKIGGFNLGTHTTDLKEILIGGVICGDYINLSSNLISCVTRASTILGPGAKNIIVKLRNGYVSPARTCNVFEYVGDQGEALSDLKQTIKTVDKMRDLPIYMNSNYHDQDISLFDHMKFNNRFYKQKLKPDHSNHVSIKLDNMVKANYNELIDIVGNDSGLKPIMGGLRKRRFVALMGNIENCDKK